jgi:predicted ester cyclase
VAAGLRDDEARLPDLQAHIEDIIAAGDKVAVRLRFRGTHSGEFLGIPATGRAIEYISHEFYRVADGLIAEEWICSDLTACSASSADYSPPPRGR